MISGGYALIRTLKSDRPAAAISLDGVVRSRQEFSMMASRLSRGNTSADTSLKYLIHTFALHQTSGARVMKTKKLG
jgi:hypothetical protein